MVHADLDNDCLVNILYCVFNDKTVYTHWYDDCLVNTLYCAFIDKTVHRVNRQLGEQVELRHVGVAPKLKLDREDESEITFYHFIGLSQKKKQQLDIH